MAVAEDLEVAVGEVFPEEADGGKGEDEVADGSSADDENTRHGRNLKRRGAGMRPLCARIP